MRGELRARLADPVPSGPKPSVSRYSARGAGPFREPALLSAAVLQQRLGLSDDELCAVLAVDALALVAGELDHRPELAILLDLTAEAAEALGDGVLRRWVRRRGPNGVPLGHLLARDFAAFEDDLAVLAERGFVLGGG